MAHWWGIKPQTVWAWRKALGVGATTKGTSRLRSAYTEEPWAVEARAVMHATAGDPERREKIVAARRGKPRPRHVMEPARRPARVAPQRGNPAADERAHKGRGTWPPAAGRPWTPEEDGLVLALSLKDAADRIGRTVASVKSRRRTLRGKR